uniref:CKLF-like MARVEL transmembrane domain-containing protein 3 n=1 Tax=Ursus maritimus TaxID=29073 RepID=A0A452V6F4_URSMA
MRRGPATGQAAAWPTSCCPLGKDGQLEREQGSLSCWQPPGAPGQGQEWGWEKNQGVQGGARTGPKSWGCWTAGARCVSSPFTWCPSEPLPQSGLPAVLHSWEPRAVTTPISPQDFLRCVTAALIYFAISITAVAKYSDGASKAAGVFGFFATIVFAIDFYLIFNDVAKFLKQGDSAEENTANKAEEENSDSDSD